MRWGLLWFVAAFLTASAAGGEELKPVTWRGQPALLLTGVIDEGSGDRFSAAIGAIAASSDGARLLLLDSPGGIIDEAMKMSDAMKDIAVHTVIPDGAHCASACASIAFLAGKYRTVEAFGLFGQHSCSRGGVPDQECNDELAQNAVIHGISNGAVAAFVTYVAPDDIAWLSREDADAWGLTRYPGEAESGFERSEPRIYQLLKREHLPAQSAWRIDFREDGYRAFLRPYSDEIRELQLNLFCTENLKGRLFLSMEVNGPAEKVTDAVVKMNVTTDSFNWEDEKPLIWQADRLVTEIITEVPVDQIKGLLSESKTLAVEVSTKPPIEHLIARTQLETSRKVLIFAANHCASGRYDGPRAALN